jgi:hypothetical protein
MTAADNAAQQGPAIGPDDDGPLRDRIGMYTKLFGVGVVAIVVVGGVIGMFGSTAVPVAIGYTAITVGAAMALIGGISGGGYASLGAGLVDRMTEGRHDQHQSPSATSVRHDHAALPPSGPGSKNRLQKGLRPEKNPTAFWSVIGGFTYAVLGAILVLA